MAEGPHRFSYALVLDENGSSLTRPAAQGPQSNAYKTNT